MDYGERDDIAERYGLVMGRIREISADPGPSVEGRYRDYFRRAADLLILAGDTLEKEERGTLHDRGIEECEETDRLFYGELSEECYGGSFANPDVAERLIGGSMGSALCFLYTELRASAAYAFEGRREDVVILCELFVEVYGCFAAAEPGEDIEDGVRQAICGFFHDYVGRFIGRTVRELVDPSLDFFTKIVMESDLSDVRYLYRYGEPIGRNEILTAEYLNSLDEAQIRSMADTFTEGYRIGFSVTGKDIGKKSTVDIRYPIGFERVVRAAILNFREMGLKPVIYRDGVNSMGGRGNGKTGCYSASVNRQFDYDHKSDRAFYLDKAFAERMLEELRSSYEKYKDLAAGYAGPAVIETFGEEPFSPVNKPSALRYSDVQQDLNVSLAAEKGRIMNRYIKGEERSYTIIAYPLPAIGDSYREIFARTVEINTLDYMLYRDMQQKIIDVLDLADHVIVRGRGGNRTNLSIKIRRLDDPSRQTAFENCVADVNIPVGEVFTSPVLSGTDGTLHVGRFFLDGTRYEDMELVFKDGMVADYSCANFADAEENRKFVRDNVLMHHDTLPMGEFAIGTNTAAYRMARDFDIWDRLPVLIAEKTGPHFAVGDTCYSHAEDTPVYNPDGKEIVARENEVSALRGEDELKAYANCHTDITIPYDELGEIIAVAADGTEHPIIMGGRFAVPGTERLNAALDCE